MKDATFEKFQMSEGNRAAFEVCQAVAALEYQGACPVVLLGVQGCGKSHLLWSIVQRIRSSPIKAGLGFVLSREFPEKVRDLVRDPSPIRQGRPAILLVDELEKFQENAPLLEHVVQLFLSNGHVVVLAASVHPERLDVFTPAFKNLLSRGRVIEMRLLPAVGGAEVEAMREEIAALHAEVETLRWERFELERKLADSVAQVVSRNREEMDRLRGQCEEARAEADTALAEQARLQGVLAQGQGDERLLAAHAERDAVRADLAKLQDEMAAALTRLGAYKTAFAERRVAIPIEDTPDPANAEVHALNMALAEAQSLARAFEIQLNEDRERFTRQLAQATAERDHAGALLEEARAEQGRMSVLLDAARGRLGVIEPELEKAHRQAALQMAEVDGLRHAAAQQAAKASIQAGEMEQRVGHLESALQMMRQTSHAAGAALTRVSEDLQRGARTLDDLASRHASVLAAMGPEADTMAQGTLFEPDGVTDFEQEPGEEPFQSRESTPSLSEMVERALYPETEA